MLTSTRIGINVATHVFQLHGIDERGYTVLRRRIARTQLRACFAQLRPCLVGIEACGSAHHWARELRALGHDVRLIAPQFVAPYRKNDKNDGSDAEAICEAVGRPHMRFVPVKEVEQQAVLTVHRARQLLVAERTALVNQTRGLLAEYGLIVSTGVRALPELLESPALPGLARDVFADLADRLWALDERITTYDRRVTQLARQTEPAQRLMQPPTWGRSPLQRWWPPSGMPMPSRTAVSLRRGWAWSPGNIPVAAPDGWAESPSAGMSISARC